MTMKGQAVLECVMGCCKAHKKGYSFPSQKKMVELIKTYQGIILGERTVRRWVKWFKDHKFWDVSRRTRRLKDGGRVWTSNLYKLRHKSYMWARRMEVFSVGVFSVFQRPKVAAYQAMQKQASSLATASSVENVLNEVRLVPREEARRRIGEWLRGAK